MCKRIVGDEPGIDDIIFSAQIQAAGMVFDQRCVDQADMMAGLLQKGGQGTAVDAGLLETKVQSLTVADALDPGDELRMALGAGVKLAVGTRAVLVQQHTGVEAELGDINAESTASARQGGLRCGYHTPGNGVAGCGSAAA